jgi:hypothetical protein
VRRTPLISFLQTLFRGFFSVLLALVLLFEEWGWEPLARILARFAQLPFWARVETRIQHLPRWGALLVFAVPMLLLLPIKLLALYLFGMGSKGWGIVLLLSAKLIGTAIVARLFQLTEPTLMQFAWFARLYPRWKRWKDALTARVKASTVWCGTRERVTRWRAAVRGWWA